VQTWLEAFIKDLVTKPEAVSIHLSQGIKTKIFEITMAKEDQSLFKRNQQRLLKALTAVVGLEGSRDRIRYVLKVGG
jgi:predicted RNA-binding protein YlqC (UPF0109 family)